MNLNINNKYNSNINNYSKKINISKIYANKFNNINNTLTTTNTSEEYNELSELLLDFSNNDQYSNKYSNNYYNNITQKSNFYSNNNQKIINKFTEFIKYRNNKHLLTIFFVENNCSFFNKAHEYLSNNLHNCDDFIEIIEFKELTEFKIEKLILDLIKDNSWQLNSSLKISLDDVKRYMNYSNLALLCNNSFLFELNNSFYNKNIIKYIKELKSNNNKNDYLIYNSRLNNIDPFLVKNKILFNKRLNIQSNTCEGNLKKEDYNKYYIYILYFNPVRLVQSCSSSYEFLKKLLLKDYMLHVNDLGELSNISDVYSLTDTLNISYDKEENNFNKLIIEVYSLLAYNQSQYSIKSSKPNNSLFDNEVNNNKPEIKLAFNKYYNSSFYLRHYCDKIKFINNSVLKYNSFKININDGGISYELFNKLIDKKRDILTYFGHQNNDVTIDKLKKVYGKLSFKLVKNN